MIEYHVAFTVGGFTVPLDDNDVIVAAVWDPNAKDVCLYIEPGPYAHGMKNRDHHFFDGRGSSFSTTVEPAIHRATVVKPNEPRISLSFESVMAAPATGVSTVQVLNDVMLDSAGGHAVRHLYQTDWGRYPTDYKATNPKDWTQAEVLAEMAQILRASVNSRGAFEKDLQPRLDRVIAAIQAHTD